MQLLRLCGLLALVAVGIQEVAPQKQVLITFPKDTPQSTLDTYRTAITSAVCMPRTFHPPWRLTMIRRDRFSMNIS